jgi:UMF1 family MFS transporter
MMGKFATLIGPLLIGFVTSWTHNHRIGLASIIILFFAGGVFLLFVKENEKNY